LYGNQNQKSDIEASLGCTWYLSFIWV